MKSNSVFNNLVRLNCLACAVGAATLMSGNVLAVDLKPHKVGTTDVTAMVTTSFGYGDNVFRGSRDETSSGFASVKPQVEAVRETNEQRFSVGYEGDGNVFFDSSDDNFLSSKVYVDYIRKLSSASEFNIGASFEDGNTIRGVDITEGTNGAVQGPTEFTRQDFNLGYAIGSAKVGPSVELAYNYSDLEFDNFEIVNVGRDYKLDDLSARIGYQYSVATKFFIDLGYRDFDYDDIARALGAELDNSEQSVHVGIKWKLSRLTSGEFSIGTTDKEFDNFSDPSSFTTWNAKLEWTPTARDTLSLESFSRPFEQAGTGIFQDVDQTSLNWKRNVSRRFSVSGGFTVGSVDFGSIGRDDDINLFNLGLFYTPTKYSEWSLNYEREDKDSNFPQFDFENNTVFVTYAVSL